MIYFQIIVTKIIEESIGRALSRKLLRKGGTAEDHNLWKLPKFVFCFNQGQKWSIKAKGLYAGNICDLTINDLKGPSAF